MIKLKSLSGAVLSLSIFSSMTFGQTAEDIERAQDQLSRLQQSLENRIVQFEDLENEVANYDERIKEAKAQVAEREAEVAKAEDDLREARIALAGSDTEVNQRKV